MSTVVATLPPSVGESGSSDDRSTPPDLPLLIEDTCGCRVLFRDVVPADIDEIRDLHARCSETTLRRRYFGEPNVEELLGWVFDRGEGLAVGAFVGDRLVGLGHLMAPDWTGAAEVAFMVDDSYQGRRIGTALVEVVIALGGGQHYPKLHAEVSLDNGKMRQILVHRGFSSTPAQGCYGMDRRLS